MNIMRSSHTTDGQKPEWGAGIAQWLESQTRS